MKTDKNHYKSSVSINDVDINKIVVPNKVPFGKQDFKYLISYKDVKNMKPLCIFRPRMSIFKEIC